MLSIHTYGHGDNQRVKYGQDDWHTLEASLSDSMKLYNWNLSYSEWKGNHTHVRTYVSRNCQVPK